MPRFPLALVALLVAVLVGGCGGGEVAYTEVKSAPPSLPIPQDQGEAAATDVNASDTDGSDGVTTKKTDGTTDTSGTTTGTTTTPSTSTGTTTAPSTSTGTTTAPTTPSTGTGGSTTGGAAPTTPTTPTTPSGGSGTGGASPDGNDQFCADNPGACNGD